MTQQLSRMRELEHQRPPSERLAASEPMETTDGQPPGEGLAPSIATPVEASVTTRRPASQPKPAPTVARTPAVARPAAVSTPWKPPTPYGFIVASFVVPTADLSESALVIARKRGEAQVTALQKRGLTRARLVETRTADRVTYRVLADDIGRAHV